MIRVIHDKQTFSDLFLAFLLARSMRTQADLVDQLFNPSEKRLARILLLNGRVRKKPGEPHQLIPKISQETLANMIGATRSKVSFFMNRFRRMGFIDYNGRILVDKSLLNVVLHDELPGQNTEAPALFANQQGDPNWSDKRIELHPLPPGRRPDGIPRRKMTTRPAPNDPAAASKT